ncbi:Acg family FMN-binding oxidoreductase [Streptomyces sp. NPDC059517]|uniref:Acg family FMN-binding oxidoreductase n=1 Tax=Streptomyces sp. NPDC059517 TaxID=3346855 RepID=UPI003675CEE3
MRSAVLDVTTLENLVSAAVAAPSIHNTQPWRFRLDPDTLTLEIRAAAARGLRHTDPTGRGLYLSVGCALLNLRIAVAHHGWEPVSRLLPRPDEPDLLATVRPSGTAAASSTPRLYGTLWRRHSSRFPFSGRQLPTAVLTELAEAAHVEGARLSVPGPAESDRLLRLTREAEHRNTADPDRAAESRRWVHGPADDALGIPPAALGPQDFRERLPMRDFGAHRHPDALTARPFEERPSIAVLSTAHDRRADWLRAGQALERVLLVATTYGVRSSLLHQALEWPDLREQLMEAPGGRGAHAQMVLRLGYGPQGPPSPRRTADQVLAEEPLSIPVPGAGGPVRDGAPRPRDSRHGG